ncbi:MAG: alpha/beta fold hydrolase [Chthoniobacterales bacterium]
MKFVCLAVVAASALVASFSCPGAEPLRHVRVNGVELHYLEQGRGIPVLFVHGGLVDYRRWASQIQPFARHYRVITYSRRYNFPNHNTPLDPVYSPAVDADDLAALINKLQLGRVHVIGESYGAYTALFLAVHHPELVRSLVLAEAPMLRWLKSTPEGRVAFADFQERLWQPVGRAFGGRDPGEAMKIIVSYFFNGATVDSIPADVRTQLKANLREWQALTASRDAFPSLSREEVAGISAPTLLMGGQHTLLLHRLLDAQYAALLPHNRRVIIPKATHEMWDEQPVACAEAALTFLDRGK